MEDVKEVYDAIVIGAGISGIATVKCLRDVGLNVLCLERSNHVGGLWTFREKGYGVMRFTHINVSKQNYAFSDFPFPDESIDYVHNQEMADYVQRYVKNFKVDEHIRFNTQVNSLEKSGDEWHLVTESTEEDKDGVVTATGKTQQLYCRNVAIASGHHAKPVYPDFPGLDTFTGKTLHSVDFNDVESNGFAGKRVIMVGIGNSAVDAATNCASVGKCRPVILSSRSGAWVVPNYIFGSPTDHYACRAFLKLPWKLATTIFEGVISLVSGSPKTWKLNPKMRALQTQPTVSPTLIHHIQRGEIKIKPNIKSISGNTITFSDDSTAEADVLMFCTGYKIDLPYLPQYIKAGILNEQTNEIQLYRNVFAPGVGKSLAFIGFVQPASGGVLTMSEMQARWFSELCKDHVFLPSEDNMKVDIRKDMDYVRKRWFHSSRHTIQRDPIIYNDGIAEMIGAKPELTKHPWIAWRLLLGSCGASQWRLQGPGKWERAEEEVCKVPVTPFILWGLVVGFLVLLWVFMWMLTYVLDEWFDIELFD